MTLSEIHALVREEMQQVDYLITNHLHPSLELINQLGHYIINNGGKRIRPLLTLLSAKAFQYEGKHHIRLAAIIEFIHTATLLHDDVVDASLLRRGHETANFIWGNQSSILVGDYLFSRAFQMMVEINSLRVMEILSNAANTIAAGEVRQLMNCHNPSITETEYYQVITDKTAKLFSAATELGALISGQQEKTIQALAAYGHHLGIAFQLTDDILDYTGDPEKMGKNIGDDLAEGKPTMPLIYAMKQTTPEIQTLMRQTVLKGDITQLSLIQEIIEATDSITYTYNQAKYYVDNACACLSVLNASEYKNALVDIAEFCIQRCI